MNAYKLEFQGYTWDEYFYIIANKSGILITYRGGLDCEGAIKLDEIVYMGESDNFNNIYGSEEFSMVRQNINANDWLFFSYAQISADKREMVFRALTSRFLKDEVVYSNKEEIKIECKGACALFPKEIMAKS